MKRSMDWFSYTDRLQFVACVAVTVAVVKVDPDGFELPGVKFQFPPFKISIFDVEEADGAGFDFVCRTAFG